RSQGDRRRLSGIPTRQGHRHYLSSMLDSYYRVRAANYLFQTSLPLVFLVLIAILAYNPAFSVGSYPNNGSTSKFSGLLPTN
ncbi:MAG: hypothetical protein KAG66_04625, partial [Methylococcales bacterium]|nr:hypothetical protein [Methylococcales bacterium]